MKVFIHVGLQKTGTTALQELVFRKMDVNYVRYLDREIYSMTLDESKPLLISNEDLCGTPHMLYANGGDRYQMARNLAGLFPNANIIIGVRSHDTWLKSMYYESVRQGLCMGYKRFSEVFPKDMLDFNKYIFELTRLFPNVYVYSFEELQRDFDKVVNGICEFIGVEPPEYVVRKMNLSLKGWQMPGFRLMNRFLYSKEANPNGFIPKAFFYYWYNLIREDGLQ